jgi:ribosomal protein S18 acetylase RimI-like enzyme
MTYQYVDRLPTPEEHRALCESVGWGPAFEWSAMPASLAGSVCGVTVLQNGEPVGMGRVVGDGTFYFYVQDVVVLPELHGRGIGDEVLRRLVAQVDAVAPPKAFIGLFAAGSSTAFYERHGFAVHEGMTGMFRVVPERPLS